MLTRILLTAVSGMLLLSSCRPKPIDIDVPQTSGALSIASYCPDNHTVYVSVSYSVGAIMKLADTTTLGKIPSATKDVLMDSALVTLRNPDGRLDTLNKVSPGLYKRSDLSLVPWESYRLTVHDRRKGTISTATTTYVPMPALDTLHPVRKVAGADTAYRLHLKVRDAKPGSYYFISYNTTRQAREHSSPQLPMSTRALNLFLPKQIALFTTSSTQNGIEQDVPLLVNASDTVLVQIAEVDRPYYDFLTAYKRTGALVNQLTGEPINLPTNISSGYGYFSLYNPVRALYNLNKY